MTVSIRRLPEGALQTATSIALYVGVAWIALGCGGPADADAGAGGNSGADAGSLDASLDSGEVVEAGATADAGELVMDGRTVRLAAARSAAPPPPRAGRVEDERAVGARSRGAAAGPKAYSRRPTTAARSEG
jgi:hypothetical protein